MASFFSTVRQGFGRGNNKGGPQSGRGNGQSSPSPTFQPSASATSLVPSVSPIPSSPAFPPPMSFDNMSPQDGQAPMGRRPAYFFREEYSTLIVKGNFMTLCAQPKLVERGEWLAHQVVEQYRLLDLMIQIVRTVDDKTGLQICNPQCCPTMSAAGHTYTWLDAQKRPIKIPAFQYISLVQKWIMGKISDPALFPTDTNSAPTTFASPSPSGTPIGAGPTTVNTPFQSLAGKEWLGKSSGFPEKFESDIQSIYRQMMRCYAHLYHGHWLDPFWNLGAYKELNTCFIHFVNVGRYFGLLSEKEMEPMQPLIEIWQAKGLLGPTASELAAQAAPAPAPAPMPVAAAMPPPEVPNVI